MINITDAASPAPGPPYARKVSQERAQSLPRMNTDEIAKLLKDIPDKPLKLEDFEKEEDYKVLEDDKSTENERMDAGKRILTKFVDHLKDCIDDPELQVSQVPRLVKKGGDTGREVPSSRTMYYHVLYNGKVAFDGPWKRSEKIVTEMWKKFTAGKMEPIPDDMAYLGKVYPKRESWEDSDLYEESAEDSREQNEKKKRTKTIFAKFAAHIKECLDQGKPITKVPWLVKRYSDMPGSSKIIKYVRERCRTWLSNEEIARKIFKKMVQRKHH